MEPNYIELDETVAKNYYENNKNAVIYITTRKIFSIYKDECFRYVKEHSAVISHEPKIDGSIPSFEEQVRLYKLNEFNTGDTLGKLRLVKVPLTYYVLKDLARR